MRMRGWDISFHFVSVWLTESGRRRKAMCLFSQREVLLHPDGKEKGGGLTSPRVSGSSSAQQTPSQGLQYALGRQEPSSCLCWPALGRPGGGRVVTGHCHGRSKRGWQKESCLPIFLVEEMTSKAYLYTRTIHAAKTALRHLRGGGNLFDVLA